MKVSLKTITPQAETNIVEIARVSSTRKDKTEAPEGLVNYLIKNNHWSPFEHSFVTFEITTSKAIGIQLLRHRSFTFQELSQRYADISKAKGDELFEPIELRMQAESNRQSSTDVADPAIEYGVLGHQAASQCIAYYLERGKELYEALLKAGVAREQARMILPMTTSTNLYMSGSIRSWIHFLDIRDDAHAQKEVQLIAREIKKILIQELPIIAKARGWVV